MSTKAKLIAETCSGPEALLRNVYCMALCPENLPEGEDALPHEMREDIAIAYYWVRDEKPYTHVMPVSYELILWLDIREETLKEAAWKNTLSGKNAVFMPLSHVLGEEEPDDGLPLFVLSNEEMHLGAIAIFYPGLLDLIADKLGCDLYILPSSIHECLIVPSWARSDAPRLREIVKKVNDTEVRKEELLSYHVYRYSRRDRTLSVDNT